MIDEKVVEKLREKYNFHPMIFHRSMEHAKSAGELFDILHDFPQKFPVMWDDVSRRWITVKDSTCAKEQLQ